jgi:hypothetical protein
MEKIKGVDDVLKDLGINPETKATIAYKAWKPWDGMMRADSPHVNDPQGFKGIYGGYKIAETTTPDGRPSTFDMFFFDALEGSKPITGETGWAVSSSFQLEELKKVKPGTPIIIVFKGQTKNKNQGNTNDINWYFANPDDVKIRVAAAALPPSNAAQLAVEARQLSEQSTIPAEGGANGAQTGIPF